MKKLEELDISKWLDRLGGYVYMGIIKAYVAFRRKQFKSNSEIRKLAKRYAKRNDISEEEALTKYELPEQQ